ncbi:MAG: hypothetical protein EA397_11720 [Deltaproteobacteria bacterium]|nr:MAG: hypothetical protein EA397_11720 [Deltaproteobacteria bacterium]
MHALLESLDPAVWSEEVPASARARLKGLRIELHGLLQDWGEEREPALRAAIQALLHALPDPASLDEQPETWDALRTALEDPYEALVHEIEQRGAPARHLRPTNWARTSTHFAAGIGVALAYEHLLTPSTAIVAAAAFVCWAWSLEIGRKYSTRLNDFLMAAFSPITRAHERYRVNSATWFGTALLLLTLFVPGASGVVGVLILGVADPVAGFVGRRYGRTRFPSGRSLEGSLAFALSGFVVGFAYLILYRPSLGWWPAFAMAAAASIVGALTELFATRIDDNLAVPVASAIAAASIGWWIGM